ncbi:PIN domain-containing protein [Nocardia cyriacigeorgica]|uniref:Ribonuclease VapC n=1 Tax=Nocardia cyriacigeorgica TaxID=135487 RepID=A0A6P1CSB2_9NOCA|nr:TA system VapC family ribonuclease toxin [Nocardia cyriacigeorgica]MBF6083811.1 PIN domain-containing protein [Nocardia cyriacigeorgica]NEW33015.1 PIN domain-containing protein [Nocardia cyriacigeorgica]
MTALLDANLLIALLVTDHTHHDAAERWFTETTDAIATCPITQGSLLRLLLREGQTAQTALAVLDTLTQHSRHEFWPDSLTFGDIEMRAVIGHRQVTDAYLAALARSRRGRLVTFDKGLAACHPDVVDLVEPN